MKRNKVKGYLKRIVLTGVMISSLAMLTGCRLAKEEKKDALILDDKLVGCFVTMNPVGNGKIYADMVKVEDDLNYHYEYKFEGYDGVEMYATTIINREGGNDYDIASYGEEVCHTKTNFHSEGEDGVKYEEVEGTLYYTGGEKYFYVNPVYQEKDGDVYMVQTDMAQYTSGHGQMSQTLTGTAAYYGNDEQTGETSKVKVTFISKQEPDKIRFIYMNESNDALLEEEYEPGEVPDEIKVMEDVEYIIIESYGYDAVEEMDTVIREICNENDENDGIITTFMSDEKGYCVGKSTRTVWD